MLADQPTYRVTETLQVSERLLVYRGVRCQDERPIVLKVLGPRHTLRSDVEQLERELAISRELDGAGLRALALDQFQGLPALVLEDIGGRPLSDLLGQPMPPEQFLPLAAAMADALAAVHARNFIHKDVRPANLIVRELTEVRITGFGAASALPRESASARIRAQAEGTLAYMSPEQTGRMSRSIDQRSDLYSLGVTFFEMLTGRLPFVASDPLAWVHCHVARQPPAPRDLVPRVPQVLSCIVLKLLAKAAEDRYQSAAALGHDLRRCLTNWQTTGTLPHFSLGEAGRSERLAPPQKLYGRERPTAQLLAAFDRVLVSGHTELVFVSGYAGVGKSSLVHELHRPVVAARGLFLEGKFDANQRDIPYLTIVRAFREVILDILTESDERIAAWRERIAQAVGSNGRLLLEVIPQLALVIGPQPPVPELRPSEAQHRFAQLFRRFIAAFPTPSQPMVLFVDDLQWADRASLALLEELATDPDCRSLLLVGAFRDNEVEPGQPLAQMLERVARLGAAPEHIVLGALSPSDLAALISDMLGRPPQPLDELVALTHARTDGNPFFAIELLSTLHEEGLLALDPLSRRWRWDMAAIAARGNTRNVVDFMVDKLTRLPAAARSLLTVVACLGEGQEVDRLAALTGRTAAEVERVLLEVARQGMLSRTGRTYRFSHDRVQQAAYLLIPEAERAATHLRIGRTLLALTPPEALDDATFEIVNQLNQGVQLITDRAEALRLAELNLRAGQKAKASNAHATALRHLAAAEHLLGADAWRTHYHLAHPLHLTFAECQLLQGDLDAAMARAMAVERESRSPRERVPALLLQRDVHLAHGRPDDAVASDLAALESLGIRVPRHPKAEDLAAARARVRQLLGERPIEAIAELPPVTDPDLEAALLLTSSASFTDPDLYLMQAATMVAVSLEHGNAEGSVFWYGCYGFILAGLGEHQEGHRFAQAAHSLVEKRGFVRSRGQALFFLGITSFWVEPLAEARAYTRTAVELWMDTGPMAGAALAIVGRLLGTLVAGEPLDRVAGDLDAALAFLRKIAHLDGADMCLVLRQLVRNLRGETHAPGSLSDDDFDEEAFAHGLGAPRLRRLVCWYWLVRARAQLLAGNHRMALEASERAMTLRWSVNGNIPERDLVLCHALALAAAFDDGTPEERRRWLLGLLEDRRQLARWARLNPGTFRHSHALVCAEIARISGRHSEAAGLYDDSIAAASAGGFLPDEALAYESMARLRDAQGLQAMADLARREARACYARWGAAGKVGQLDARYPHLAVEGSPSSSTAALSNPEQIDLQSVVKASQAISREFVLDRLLQTLMEVVLAQSGAARAVLLLSDDSARVELEATLEPASGEVALAPVAPGSAAVPQSLLRLVARTGQSVVLDDAASERRFSDDEYIASHRPRSVLCLPIKRAEVMGLLYLENNALTGAFTPDRLTVLEVLAAQAAISLENARFVERQQQARAAAEEAERRAAFLEEAGALLSESLDHRVVLRRLAHLVVRSLADWCVIDLVEDEGIRRVGGAHADPRRQPLMARLEQEYPPRWDSPQPAVQVIKTGQPLLVPEATPQAIRDACVDDEHVRLVSVLGATSGLVAPLRIRERVLGAITMGLGHPTRRYGQADLELAEELARRAAAAVDNAQLYRQMQEAVRLRDEFLSIASHELNTPMTALTLTLQTMNQARAGGREPELLVRMAALAERQGQRLTRLIGDLLDVTRIERGTMTLQREAVDLGTLVRDAVARFEPELRRARCSVSVQVDGRVVGRWDPLRLDQVVLNLLSNAAKFGDAKPISVAVGHAAGAARLVVRDQGIGIDPARINHVFERFARAVSAQHYGGLGLGLYICRRIVDAHSGSIAVESTPGRGSTFTVTLPIAPPSPA